MYTVEIEIYKFSELSTEAQKNALSDARAYTEGSPVSDETLIEDISEYGFLINGQQYDTT